MIPEVWRRMDWNDNEIEEYIHHYRNERNILTRRKNEASERLKFFKGLRRGEEGCTVKS
jgi:hypothetical protein